MIVNEPPVAPCRTASPSHRGLAALIIAGLAWGGSGGVLGAFMGHWAVILAHRWTGDADIWLKGPHGPPFFDLALSMGFFYAGLGALISRGDSAARARGSGLGFAAAFAGLTVPMTIATHAFAWGEGPHAPPTRAWLYLVLAAYVAATACAAFVLGFFARSPRSSIRGVRALGGAAAAWLLQLGARILFPKWGQNFEVFGILPPPSAVYSGAVWGALIGLGIAAADSASRLREEGDYLGR